MKVSVGLARENPEERLAKRGVNRRDFLKFCTAVAVTMGMGPGFAAEVALALTAKRRPSVVYLHFAECTGCTESVLRTTNPFLDELIFDTISLDYQETIMAAAGHAAEEALEKAVSSKDGFICIVEGAIPTAENGIFGKVGNHTMLDIANRIPTKALHNIAYGTCAAYGGIQAAKPNPTGAKGLEDAVPSLKGKVINIPGCPPNPINLVGTIVHVLQNKAVPPLDKLGRPNMFFGESVHDNCERREHFEAGNFAPSFESEEARKGYCLYNLGCKGPDTYNNCPKAKFNGVSWPVQAGHPCIGCSEPNFWDKMTPFFEN
ncbi:hydrogenase small subunit [Desulfovibrio litoralis]|uniref:cytochrome-c3 hydrogenase n=1 Tax=Desulfovibrio litoralis DSM 11393 TaxID=1121455 RepID=A0A1M7SWA8_9BACT|nr:hydrogenase small subunit [Desulfovibrio litoralis]SHN62730.1 [NiFe] hydrogenase small subunit [Desulfovibrio litoralis DSM 11393]